MVGTQQTTSALFYSLFGGQVCRQYIHTYPYSRCLLGLYIMYTYMISQRRKVLGKPKTVKTS